MSLSQRADVLPSKLLGLGPKVLKKAAENELLVAYGSGVYPIKATMGVPSREGTHADRAARLVAATRPPLETQFDFIKASGDKAFRAAPFNTQIKYVNSSNASGVEPRLKVGQTSLRSLCDDLRRWQSGSGMHWRLSKPALMLVDEETYSAADGDASHWLNRVLTDLDANRFFSLATSLYTLNSGNNFLHDAEHGTQNAHVSLKDTLLRLACNSYDGDFRTMDALSIESMVTNKWGRSLSQHPLPWLHTYLPLLQKHHKTLGLILPGDTSVVDKIVDLGGELEKRRLAEMEEQIQTNTRRAMPSDAELMADESNNYKDILDIMNRLTLERDMAFWMEDERLGLEQPVGSLYEILPVGLKNYTNVISSRTRLLKLYGPSWLLRQKFTTLGGPLPMNPEMIRKGVRKLNRVESAKMGINGLFSHGVIPSVKYLQEKRSRSLTAP